MLIHSDPLLYIYFGDARSSLKREFLMNECAQDKLLCTTQLADVKKLMHLDSLVLLRQIHSTLGVSVSETELNHLLQSKVEGDYLTTQGEHIGLGVYTADCLPIIFYDTCNRAVGICHAGWVGSVKQIALETLESMQKTYGTELHHLRIFFGPSARVCCYEVTPEFAKHLDAFPFKDQLIIEVGEKLHFDLPLFNKLLLESYGVRKEAFHMNYNLCTICNPSFCSSRRNKESMDRQLTIVALK